MTICTTLCCHAMPYPGLDVLYPLSVDYVSLFSQFKVSRVNLNATRLFGCVYVADGYERAQ